MPSWNQCGRTAGFSISQYLAVNSPKFTAEMRLCHESRCNVIASAELRVRAGEARTAGEKRRLRRTAGRRSGADFCFSRKESEGRDIVRFGVDINTILMFDDRIEVTWPGGLPAGLSEEEYLKGNVSVLRNPILENIFYRLHLVEILGTGVRRIRDSYRSSANNPEFEVSENLIKVTLPVMNVLKLSEDEELVYKALSKTIPRSSGEITEAVPFGKSKTTTILKKLVKNNYVTVVGRGRGTKYKL